MKHQIQFYVFTFLYITVQSRPKILRNNALMTRMITHFQQDNNNLSIEPAKQSQNLERNEHNQERNDQNQERNNQIQERNDQNQERNNQIQERNDQNLEGNDQNQEGNLQSQQSPGTVMNLMQNVLCRNFPTIPCKIIMKDDALNKLIQKSIRQITNKKIQLDNPKTPSPQESRTHYPLVDSEDLSNFLEVSNTGFFNEKGDTRHLNYRPRKKNQWSHEKSPKQKIKRNKEPKSGTELYNGHKKMRKFYPHKIKYKDKGMKNRGEYRDYTEEKISMSAEFPDMPLGLPQKTNRMAFKVEQSDAPVWRIDYMKHSIPSMNMEFQDDPLRGKLMKSGPPGIAANDNDRKKQQNMSVQQKHMLHKEVLRPDVYIKKSVFINNANMNSDVLD